MLALIAGKDPELEIGGGHSAYVRAHARAARRAGYRPHVFCAGRSGEARETDFGTVHRVRSLWPLRPVPGMGSPSYLTLSVLHVRQIERAVRRALASRPGPHVVHGFGVWASAGVRARDGLGGARAAGVRVLASSYTTNAHESAGKLVGWVPAHGAAARRLSRAQDLWIRRVVDREERRALRGADAVLVNYASVRELLRARHPLARAVRRLPYAPESAFAPEREGPPPAAPACVARLEPREAPLVVALSRHDPRKGIPVLLEALAALRRRGTPFRACLVGGGTLLEAHRRLAARLGLAAHVAVPGFLPDPLPLLEHADVFALPSLQEGSGSLSLLEALRAGLAVVASDVDGVSEDVRHDGNGLLVKPGSADDLARGIARLLGDPALRQRLGRAARRDARRRFAADGLADALRGIYTEMGLPPDGEDARPA